MRTEQRATYLQLTTSNTLPVAGRPLFSSLLFRSPPKLPVALEILVVKTKRLCFYVILRLFYCNIQLFDCPNWADWFHYNTNCDCYNIFITKQYATEESLKSASDTQLFTGPFSRPVRKKICGPDPTHPDCSPSDIGLKWGLNDNDSSLFSKRFSNAIADSWQINECSWNCCHMMKYTAFW